MIAERKVCGGSQGCTHVFSFEFHSVALRNNFSLKVRIFVSIALPLKYTGTGPAKNTDFTLLDNIYSKKLASAISARLKCETRNSCFACNTYACFVG